MSKGQNNSFHSQSPILWEELKNHAEICNFHYCKTTGCNTKKKESVYPNAKSVTLAEHRDLNVVPPSMQAEVISSDAKNVSEPDADSELGAEPYFHSHN